jgi:alanyl-tRNA synthetase
VEELPAGVEAEAVIDPTPFYAESGGQVGDVGRLYDESGSRRLAEVLTTYAPVKGLHVCKIRTLAPLMRGARVGAQVDEQLRASTRRNHTATHLLQAALQQVLGKHVKQAGSVVEPARLRFDFTHYAAMSASERAEVERLVNEEVLKNVPVGVEVMNLDDALHTGAMALFGEKYGDRVRVVSVPGFSRELCGGTHVSRTGDIGIARITYEGSISSGVRRIEMLTGPAVLTRFDSEKAELASEIEKIREQHRALEREVARLRESRAADQASKVRDSGRDVNGYRVYVQRLNDVDRIQMRSIADQVRANAQRTIVVLGTATDEGVALTTAVTKDSTSAVHAGKLVGRLAQFVGGKGGGRPDLAEAGGKDVGSLDKALELASSVIDEMTKQ